MLNGILFIVAAVLIILGVVSAYIAWNKESEYYIRKGACGYFN